MENIFPDRRIKLRHLEAFTAIARLGSLKAACAALNLTQPALSRTLKELETVLGVTLMTRDRGGVQLTPEGTVLLDHAVRGLAALRRGLDGVAQLREGAAEPLRVGALPSVSARLMPQAVARFRRLSPATPLTVEDGAHGALTAALRAGRLDLVIGRMGAPDSMAGLSFTQLYQERCICVARPGHPILDAPRLDPARLTAWPVLYPPPGSAIRPLVERWCLAQGIADFPEKIEAISGAFGRNYLRNSEALWFISEGVVARDIDDGQLVALPLDMTLTAGPVGLMTLSQATATRSQQLFAQAAHYTASSLPFP